MGADYGAAERKWQPFPTHPRIAYRLPHDRLPQNPQSPKFDERLTISLLAMPNRFGSPVTLRNGAAAKFHSEYWEELLDQIEGGQLEWELGDHAESAEDKIKALTHKHAPEERERRW